MGRPLGSKNKPKQQSEVINTDGYANAFSMVGTSRDRTTYNRASSYSMLDQYTLESLYISDGLARRVVDLVAEEMTRCGFDVDGIDETIEDSVKSKIESIGLMPALNDAVRWSRLYGGSVIVIGANDGGTLDVPMNDDGVRDIEFLRVYDRYQATVQTRVTDPASAEYGNPELWLISPVIAGTAPYLVHNSRILVFDGEALPDRLRSTNQYWGASTLQQCYDQLTRLGMAHQHTEHVLERIQQAVHKMPNLSTLLRSPGGEAAVKARADVVDMVRGILNTIVIDGAEDYSVQSLSMSGIHDVLDRFAETLSAVSGIPMFLLLGRSPGGLNASGGADLDGWYAKIEAMQNDILRNPIMRVVDLILSSMGQGEIEWHIEFNPLKVESEKICAEVEKLKAETNKIRMETDSGYAALGVVDPSELRTSEELQDMYPTIQGELDLPASVE